MEYEANAFAAALLIDRKKVLKYALSGRTSTEIAAMLHVDVNLISIMIDRLIKEGHALNPVGRKNNILK
jgi:Zn-dependent peptidase ImmA (M78 family)